ncbi:MAG TPA: acetyl-CoA C-acetyltransferase [Victivallales bacterium]|nr:acetyl-CoA C-acetyltransferase [Victivallales bacterium]
MEVYIVDAVRTAIGSFNGTLSKLSSVDLGKAVVSAIIEKNSIDGENVDELLMGSVLTAGQGQNIARQIAVGAGIPVEKTAMTINMVCGSGLRAVSLAVQAVKAGDAELIIAGGTESMSNAAYLLPKVREGLRMGNGTVVDSMVHDGLWEIFNGHHMGVTAENLVVKYGLTREEQDEFAANSQRKAGEAIENGKFKDEIIPIEIAHRKKDSILFCEDEYPKPRTSAAILSKLRPAFKKEGGSVTAGNSSGINDGAAAVLIASEKAVKKYNLKPIAKIVSYAYCGTDPKIMGIGPVEATRKALEKTGWKLDEVGLIEANEAFAAQALSVIKELNLNPDITNVNGGAIALGHPIGASGTRILVTLLHEMKKRKAKKGLATLCIGGGMGISMCVELC